MQVAPNKCGTHPPVTVTTMIALKDIGNGNAGVRIVVWTPEASAMIEVGVAGQVFMSALGQ